MVAVSFVADLGHVNFWQVKFKASLSTLDVTFMAFGDRIRFATLVIGGVDEIPGSDQDCSAFADQ